MSRNVIHEITETNDSVSFADASVVSGKEITPSEMVSDTDLFGEAEFKIQSPVVVATTTSTTFVTMAGMAVTYTLKQKSDVLVCPNIQFMTSDAVNSALEFRITLDGSPGNAYDIGFDAVFTAWQTKGFFEVFPDVSAGSRTFDVEWRNSGSAGPTLTGGADRRSVTYLFLHKE